MDNKWGMEIIIIVFIANIGNRVIVSYSPLYNHTQFTLI